MAYLERTGKIGATFGSYGWTGEAPEMLHERLKGLKFRLPLKPLKVKLIPSEEELEACVAFGREASEIAMGKMIEMEL
jgi:flavorubredoxin